MPSPPTQSQKTHRKSVVRQMPKFAEKKPSVNPLLKFLQQELQHWKADLTEKKCEGEYFLEWFSWRESNAPESDLAKTFQKLVRKEISALERLIDGLSIGKEETDTDELLSVQNDYLKFCGRFDRIKLLILKRIDLKGNIKIY